MTIIACAYTDTFPGIYPARMPALIAAQLVGAIVCVLVLKPLFPLEAAAKERAVAA